MSAHLSALPIIGNFNKTANLMGKNTSISLGSYFEEFIQNEIATGRYSTASEVIRTALRLLETEEQKTKKLLKALKQGENSEMIENFDPATHLKSLHEKK
jgi:antitoxin ParD1/3/4